jgi:hypothetical protein
MKFLQALEGIDLLTSCCRETVAGASDMSSRFGRANEMLASLLLRRIVG